ncbi:hypothetical protein EW145_g2220 [Phellinidium pouzarii]|uniref:Enoyl reductase (ER) domain-containing protein n=1 Tax=Phellinidium pouzarii TaxID=167371 RepID=A0A4S4LBR4_9AGAM|nr:hypothetical protein EW145_g2220 [Phellinidium pouzarii]
MAPSTFTQIVLAERPTEYILPSTFEKKTVPYVSPNDNQAVVQVDYLSMEPAMRGWLNDQRSYVPPGAQSTCSWLIRSPTRFVRRAVQIGEVMRSAVLGRIVEAGKDSAFNVGDVVKGYLGWTEYVLLDDEIIKTKQVSKVDVPPKAELLDLLGVLGSSGMTAYFVRSGLYDVGKIKAGETLVVSGAAGAVGSVACQLGKIRGARVIGIAGSDDKCSWLKDELGVDAALNYKSATFHDDFRKHVGFFDVFFDNVGGEILDFALTRMNKDARILLSGAISDYNKSKPSGLRNYQLLIATRAKIQGFIVLDYVDQWPAAGAEMAAWLAEGKIKRKFTVVEGLDHATDALSMLYSGGNTGKTIVKVRTMKKGNL